jgi:hypothetical protein
VYVHAFVYFCGLVKLYVHAAVPYFIVYPFVGAVTLTVFGLCALPLYVAVLSLALALIVPLVTVAVNVLLHVA